MIDTYRDSIKEPSPSKWSGLAQAKDMLIPARGLG